MKLGLQLKHAVIAWTIAALVVNPAMAQQQSAALIKQQQARMIAERMSVDRQSSAQSALQLADSETALKEAMNGTTVVDIAAPSAKGVSKNNWTEFNVGEDGIIFNNSKGPVLTQLGGWADGNRRLAGGEAAIILNQVKGTNLSNESGSRLVAAGDLITNSVDPITFINKGDIQANRLSLTVDELINSGSLIASGKGDNVISSISANLLNNTDGLIAVEESRLSMWLIKTRMHTI
jgi:filamentous hemagglutinin family protein